MQYLKMKNADKYFALLLRIRRRRKIYTDFHGQSDFEKFRFRTKQIFYGPLMTRTLAKNRSSTMTKTLSRDLSERHYKDPGQGQ